MCTLKAPDHDEACLFVNHWQRNPAQEKKLSCNPTKVNQTKVMDFNGKVVLNSLTRFLKLLCFAELCLLFPKRIASDRFLKDTND